MATQNSNPDIEIMTRNGFEKLKTELTLLRTDRRLEVANKLEEARSFGDLSENAEYHAAKEEQEKLEELSGLSAEEAKQRLIESLKDQAMLGINAVKGFEYGEGFDGVTARGSQQNDKFVPGITTATNHSGGIQGGISNGQDIYFRVAFKPVATILKEQDTVDLEGNATKLTARGRHDPCVLPRAVPVVEAMAAMVILDSYLVNKSVKL